MIKKHYRWGVPGYFHNFMQEHYPGATFESELKRYKATLAKSKSRNHYLINVKWHNAELYCMFVLRYS